MSEELRQSDASEAPFAGLFTATNEGLLSAELVETAPECPIDFRYLEMSPVAERLLGLDPVQVLGKTTRMVFPELADGVLDHYARVTRTGESHRYIRYQPRLDQYHEHLVIRRAARQIAIIFWDVTERKRTEEKLVRTSAAMGRERERLAVALRAGQLGVYEWRVGDESIWWSPEVYPVYGVHPESFTPTVEALTNLVHPEDQRDLGRKSRECIANGETFSHEYRIIRPDGELRWIANRSHVVRDARGRAERITGIAVDVTDRVQAERDLAEAHQFLNSSLDALSSHIAVLDETGVILAVNEAWRRFADENQFLGRDYGIGSNYLDACDPDPGGCVDPAMLAGLKQVLHGNLAQFEFEYPCHSPTQQRWFVMRVTRFKSPGPTRVVVAHEDVTIRRLAEEGLKEADRRKDEFLATLAHELRNPLAPLQNGLQILRLASDDAEIAEQARLMMERQLGHMVHLVDDLLDVSRISRGKIELRKVRIELAKVIYQAVETSRPMIDAHGHEFTIDIPADAVFVEADVTRLAQVFSNLLNNAAKYTECAGHIRMTVHQEGQEVRISVRDSGIGIPAPMLAHVFDMFTQVDRTLERSQGGLGIGLSIVKRLVEMHDGDVEAHSAGPGQGSEFIVRLPIVTADQSLNRHGEDSSLAFSGRRILVVDDNRDAATSMAMMLKLMGAETRTAHDGLEALKSAETFRPHAILLDIGMPRLNGYEAAQRIRQQPWGSEMFLVALTGWGQEEDRRRSQEAGFNAHRVKPIDPVSIKHLLSSMPPP